jgi:hypothetical protein
LTPSRLSRVRHRGRLEVKPRHLRSSLDRDPLSVSRNPLSIGARNVSLQDTHESPAAFPP